MKTLRRLLFRVQVILYGLHAYRHTGLILYPDEPFFVQVAKLSKSSQIETAVVGARTRRAPHQSRRTRSSGGRYRHATV